jgi:hypothetical protein
MEDKTKRRTFGKNAGEHIRLSHDLDHNYNLLEEKLISLAERK